MITSTDVLVRRVTVDSNQTSDGRIVVAPDGRAALIARPNGQPTAMATMLNARVVIEPNNIVTVTNDEQEWRGQRDTRCASCGGRYELRALDPLPLMPQVEAVPATHSDTY